MESSYRTYLKNRIRELEDEIRNSSKEKRELELNLQKLKLAEFEEEMREENPQQLLKG